MKIISFCIQRSYEDEYTSGYKELQKLPNFSGIAYPDIGYDRLKACRMKPQFVRDMYEEHAPFLYVDADTRLLDVPEIPREIELGVCINPVMAIAKKSRYNKAWVFSASCFYVGRNYVGRKFVQSWAARMGKSGGDHFPFIQSIKGAKDITKLFAGKLEGYHKNTYYPIVCNEELSKLGREWIM